MEDQLWETRWRLRHRFRANSAGGGLTLLARTDDRSPTKGQHRRSIPVLVPQTGGAPGPGLSGESLQGRLIADQPDVPERIAEPSLTVNTPGSLAVLDLIGRAVGAGCDGPSDQGVGVVDEYLHPHGRLAEHGRALE